uniref:Hsp101 n=1 Tax=Arundo donax TaxID=35708 RepID=A0A0A9AYG1_ARUDO
MYSDISVRTSRFLSSNSCSARALASSVLPAPVGPRKRNEPVGCCGRPRPDLDLKTASATALTASCCPTTL